MCGSCSNITALCKGIDPPFYLHLPFVCPFAFHAVQPCPHFLKCMQSDVTTMRHSLSNLWKKIQLHMTSWKTYRGLSGLSLFIFLFLKKLQLCRRGSPQLITLTLPGKWTYVPTWYELTHCKKSSFVWTCKNVFELKLRFDQIATNLFDNSKTCFTIFSVMGILAFRTHGFGSYLMRVTSPY